MRTKTLLLAAAALAAGFATSSAQVYSVNVVGYVNKALPTTSVFISNPLDNGTNDLNSVLAVVPNKSTASFWNGAGFNNSIKGGAGWAPNVAIAPGLGFFVASKTATNVTFVGQVACVVGGKCTNSLPAANTAVGSIIPFTGDLNTAVFGLNIIANKSTTSFWTGSGFNSSIKGGAGWAPAIAINPADGFFISPKTATNWVETL